ncbi:MAG: RloB domain-containing protein [Clostridia bacterium]
MRKDKPFGVTTTHFNSVQNEKKKYILAYEGSKTEAQYFNAVIASRKQLGINPLIEFVPLLRSVRYETESHPNRMLSLLEEHLEKYDTVKVYIDKIVDFACEKMGISENSNYTRDMLINKLHKFFRKRGQTLNDEIKDSNIVLPLIADYLKNNILMKDKIENIRLYVEQQRVTYAPDIDDVCLIIDRDRDNFFTYQFEIVYDKCKEKGYRLFVSNPTFEFWLLLHSDKVLKYNKRDLLKNAKNGSKRYLERLLATEFHSYNKSDIMAYRFIPHICKAIKNEKFFCEDCKNLKYKLGSNIGILMSELMK